MFEGKVLSIYVGPEPGGPMKRVQEVKALDGRGLEDDRYATGSGTYSDTPGEGREVTLIEWEAIEAVRLENGIELEDSAPRRNIVTRGVPLNHLVGREFTVGDVRLRGVRLCEPCRHLEELNGQALLKPLLHRAGLRADIVHGGTIREGDPISTGG